ncbi:retrovirus-related pol polyprotein from transposon TNT 1-94 [Tanacetum coccineum]
MSKRVGLRLAVPSFLPGDDLIASLNKAMAFLSTSIASHFPTTNNQLRSSSNPRNQATVQDARVIGEGHMARQCTQLKRPRNSAWFKEKLMLVETQESGQVCYLRETESAVVQNNTSSYQQNAMIMLVFDALFDQVAKCTADNLKHKELDESLTAELEKNDVICVVDSEETLLLAEKSRSKMIEKQNDPICKDRKVNISPINYAELNKLSEHFGNHFVPQKELSVEQAFWLRISNPSFEQHVVQTTPVKTETPRELPKEHTDTIRDIVEQARALTPLDNSLDYACHTNHTLVPGIGLLQAYDWATLSGNYQLGNVKIFMVYYVEGLRYNLFSVGQFCYSDLKVAFQKHTCFVRNLEGVDLISRSRDTNLYTILMDDMLKSSPISKQGLVQGLRKLKFEKDQLCSACSLGKSKKSSHKPKAKDTNQEKLYLLHMDLCGPMRVESINGKKCILVIVDDYSRFTWVKFLRSKDETPKVIIKCLKQIQVRLNAMVQNVRTDNGTEFVNQTLREYYEKDLGKLKAKADIGIFVGYAPTKKALRIYNKGTRLIMETIHVTFDEIITMASKQFSSGLVLQAMTPGTPNAAPRPIDPVGSPSSISIDIDAPSASISSTQAQEQSPIFSQGGSSSNMQSTIPPFELLSKWTKTHPLANVISGPSRLVSIRKKLQTDAIWCYFDAFLTSIKPKNFKEAMLESSWIEAM